MTELEIFVRDVPSPEAARRFLDQFTERSPAKAARLRKNEGLFSDVLAIASYSPLLATTLIQHPDYVFWLDRKRSDSFVREKEDLLESLARFALTNSQLETHVLLARFRRRELLRIFLRDIRRLGTIAEVTEEISNLADAILEYSVRLARQEIDNRYGPPFEADEHDRKRPSDICVVSLGKLGSRELNYSSDIDLLFVYSADGTTTGGTRGAVSNREYFVKFAETVTRLVGQQTGEGAAYRVDMRLRPNGRVGALALSLNETIRYYLNDARNWEQQVLIRSRASAGNASLYKGFFDAVEEKVFKSGRDAAGALHEVYLSKRKIDEEHRSDVSFDVKLGRGGIREIEFIAQALQLAHGGDDRWLRVPHTLISISRLADRGHLTERERSELSAAYDFLRRLEHILQMEHGLQTHSVPTDDVKLELIALKMRCPDAAEFAASLEKHTSSVNAIFSRVFGREIDAPPTGRNEATFPKKESTLKTTSSLEPERNVIEYPAETRNGTVDFISSVSPKFAQFLISRSWLSPDISATPDALLSRDYDLEFASGVGSARDRAEVLSGLRTTWSRLMLEIAVADVHQRLPIKAIRDRQTRLAEAGITAAIIAATRDVGQKYEVDLQPPSVLALGKLGSGTMDYDSDLDLILVSRDRDGPPVDGISPAELHSRIAEAFTNYLSGITREGNLYRVDLRLRPHGRNGPNVTTERAFVDYIQKEASVWELLAYVQLRALGQDGDLETSAREAIALRIGGENADAIRREVYDMRLRLEHQHGDARGDRDVNIKFSSGGLLDVYFVVRCLQLLKPTAIGLECRSTSCKLAAFEADGFLPAEDFAALHGGHQFLSELDHALRLTIGRSSRFPRANRPALANVVDRMKLESADDLTQQFSIHRMNVRAAFERTLGG